MAEDLWHKHSEGDGVRRGGGMSSEQIGLRQSVFSIHGPFGDCLPESVTSMLSFGAHSVSPFATEIGFITKTREKNRKESQKMDNINEI